MQQSTEENKKDVPTRNEKRRHDDRASARSGVRDGGSGAREQKEEVQETDTSEGEEGDWITEASENSESEASENSESEGC